MFCNKSFELYICIYIIILMTYRCWFLWLIVFVVSLTSITKSEFYESFEFDFQYLTTRGITPTKAVRRIILTPLHNQIQVKVYVKKMVIWSLQKFTRWPLAQINCEVFVEKKTSISLTVEFKNGPWIIPPGNEPNAWMAFVFNKRCKIKSLCLNVKSDT